MSRVKDFLKNGLDTGHECPPKWGMTGSELEYVRGQLARRTHSEWRVVSEKSGVPFRTVKRIGYKEVEYPRSDTIGKLALHFRKRRA